MCVVNVDVLKECLVYRIIEWLKVFIMILFVFLLKVI